MRSLDAARHRLAWSLGCGLAVLSLTLGCTGREDARGSERPNVLLISIDTLRSDHLSAYGYERETSPAIDALARDGALFETTLSPRGLTWPAVASLLTGQPPVQHGVRENGAYLDPRHPTLPGVLRAEGYATAAFLTNMLSARYAGFDEIHRARGPDRDERITEKALTWLAHSVDEPFFLWVHYFAPHLPYAPPEAWAQRFATGYEGPLDGTAERLYPLVLDRADLRPEELSHIVSLYDAEIAYADAQVGRLLAALEAAGLEDRTLVALTADHGEELYQRNHYFFHHCSIYDAVLRVPLVLRWPGVIEPGTRRAELAQLEDVAPTLYGLLGVAPPPDLEGLDWSAWLRRDRNDAPPQRTAVAELEGRIFSVRTPTWRYVENPTRHVPQCPPYRFARGSPRAGYTIAPRELYDLRADPAEQRDRSGEEPEIRQALAQELRRWQEAHRESPPARPPTPEALEELRELGYVE